MEINSSGTIENNFSSNFWNTNSKEFYTILNVSVLMIPMVPLNNKIRFHGIPWNWHQQFHGIPWNFECTSSMTRAIPWNLECANFADTSSSMEFHGIPWNCECANFTDTSSSMEFHGTGNAPITLTRAAPWNSMELRVRQFYWHEQFHGITWNFKCANFDDTSSSMEFHGTSSAQISMIEQFHGIPWN